MQRAHHLVRTEMDVEQTCQNTFYDYLSSGPTYSEGQQVLGFFPIVKKTENFATFYEGLYTTVEKFNDLKLCHDGLKKIINVHYERLKKYENRELFSVRMSAGLSNRTRLPHRNLG